MAQSDERRQCLEVAAGIKQHALYGLKKARLCICDLVQLVCLLSNAALAL